jgi:hypothetical protein
LVFAAAYYMALARQRAALSPAAAAMTRPPAWMMPLELTKSLILAAVIGGLVTLLGITNLLGALVLGVVLWIAFPVILLAGSVVHERVPTKLAAIHSGDWLAKLQIISVVVTLWR